MSNESVFSLIQSERRTYVQEENPKILKSVLRLLEGESRGLDYEKFRQTVDSLSIFDETLQGLIYSSLLNYLYPFSDSTETNERSPLWLKLLNKNQSSRKIPKQWHQHLKHLFMTFGISTDEILKRIDNLQTLYCLGAYDEIFQYTDSEQEVLFWKLKTDPLAFEEEEFLNSAESLSSWITPDQAWLLKARYVVVSTQNSREIKKWERFFNTGTLLSRDNIHYDSAHASIQQLNSLNYYFMIAGNGESQEKVFSQIEKLLEKVDNPTKTHLTGIYHFHQALVSIESQEKFIEHLCKAIEFDSGFFDYYYRSADHYFESNPDLAKLAFETAMATSPLTLEVVNDYGCFLNEHDPERAEQLSQIVRKLNLFTEEELNV